MKQTILKSWLLLCEESSNSISARIRYAIAVSMLDTVPEKVETISVVPCLSVTMELGVSW